MIDVAVMVEPRLHEYLKPVIDNMLRNLKSTTPIQIFHSSINIDFLKLHYTDHIVSGKLKLSMLRQTNLTIKQYNQLLTSLRFWNKIDEENVLIFQTDSCLCRHVDTFDFSPYLNYGYVGAPSTLAKPIPWQNGGFSLRKKSAMIRAIKTNKSHVTISYAEDKFFSVDKREITKPAPYELANMFSVEQYYNSNPLGIHKAWKYLSKEHWTELKTNFPEISLTFNF